MKRIIYLTAFLFLPLYLIAGQYEVESPSKKLRVSISANDNLTYSVFYNDEMIIKPSVISMTLDKGILGKTRR